MNHHKRDFQITRSKIYYSLIELQPLRCTPSCYTCLGALRTFVPSLLTCLRALRPLRALIFARLNYALCAPYLLFARLIHSRYKISSVLINTSNKGIKQAINSRRIVLVVTGRKVQRIVTWLQQRKTGCTSWTKTSPLHCQIGVAIFASFRQEKPWRQNRTPSPFLVIVRLSKRP